MHPLFMSIHRVVDHPLTNLVVALIMIGSAVVEAAGEFVEPLMQIPIRTHHGLLVMGVSQAIKAIPEANEGVKKLIHGPEEDDLPAE